MIDETLQDQAAMHALGLLEGEEAAAFRAALSKDPELQALVGEFAETAAALPHALPATKAPADVLPRLLAQIRAERLHSSRPHSHSAAKERNWMPMALAAGIAISAALGFVAGVKIASVNSQERIANLDSQIEQADAERQRLAKLIAGLKEERTAMETRIEDLRQRDAISQIRIALLKVQLKEYAKVTAVAIWDASAQHGVMRFDHLPEAGPSRDYQMWIIDPRYDTPVSAGIFTAGRGGELDVKFKPAQPIALADRFAVSIEQKGGSSKPLGPIVLLSN